MRSFCSLYSIVNTVRVGDIFSIPFNLMLINKSFLELSDRLTA